MTIQAMLDTLVLLTNLFLIVIFTSGAVYWAYLKRRIHYLEARLWLRQVGLERRGE